METARYPWNEKTPSLHRRAWALACHTRRRAGSPRHASIAGDRPPRSGKKTAPLHRSCGEKKRLPFTVGRGPVPRHATIADRITPVGQDRLILIRSGAGAPELQRWTQCLPVGGTSLSRYETHQDQEVSPTRSNQDKEVSPTGKALIYETPSVKSSQRRDIQRAKTYWQEYRETHR